MLSPVTTDDWRSWTSVGTRSLFFALPKCRCDLAVEDVAHVVSWRQTDARLAVAFVRRDLVVVSCQLLHGGSSGHRTSPLQRRCSSCVRDWDRSLLFIILLFSSSKVFRGCKNWLFHLFFARFHIVTYHGKKFEAFTCNGCRAGCQK